MSDVVELLRRALMPSERSTTLLSQWLHVMFRHSVSRQVRAVRQVHASGTHQ